MKPMTMLVLAMAAGPWAMVSAGQGSCAASNRCCLGRDSSCFVKGTAAGGYRSCYCDEGCLETGDCCSDYKETCGRKVIDCVVSSWGGWSSCDTSCGLGKQQRKRIITTHPSGGGAMCGPLVQKKTCMGSRCSAQYYKYKSPIRETAGLLPAKFYKHKPKSWDVRENLFKHTKMQQLLLAKAKQQGKMGKKGGMLSNEIEQGYQADQPYQVEEKQDYCIVFELVRVTKACRKDKDFYKLNKGQRTCALCPADARRENLGDRCKGHGVDSELTKWRSSVRSRCHGKWRRISEMSECPCAGGPDVIFV